MAHTHSIVVLISYCAATICYLLFHFNFIHTNRLVESNNTLAYTISYSLFILIPLAGLIHLSLLKLNKQAFRKIIKYSLVIGLLGPLLLHVSISMSDDAEAVWGYALIPFAYLTFCLIGYCSLFLHYCVRRKTP